MNSMGEYLRTIIGVSLLCGIISVAVPSGATKKVFKFICGLFVLLCIIAPLHSIISEISLNLKSNNEINNYTYENTADYLSEITENEIKSLVNGCVKQVTGADAIDISVTLNGDSQNFTIENVTVTIDRIYSSKQGALKELIFSRYGLDVVVIS